MPIIDDRSNDAPAGASGNVDCALAKAPRTSEVNHTRWLRDQECRDTGHVNGHDDAKIDSPFKRLRGGFEFYPEIYTVATASVVERCWQRSARPRRQACISQADAATIND